MKKLYFLFLPLLILTGCEQTSTESEVSISGRVVENQSGDPIPQAFVEILSPENLRRTVSTTETGNFTFSGLDIEGTTDILIEAKKTGFDRVSQTIVAAPGSSIELETPIRLIREGDGIDDGDGGDDGEGGVTGNASGAASLVLRNVQRQAINIAETGDEVSSAFTFQVQDSAGRALDLDNQVLVRFDILSGPGGGEDVIPNEILSNANGEVTTSIFSGNTAGPVRIQASITRADIGLTIRSTPVLIAIHGGFPDANHFGISLNPNNIEGYNIQNVRSQATVILGDEFSNPVKPGTVVYFETSGGVVQGSGITDADGVVSVELISSNPRPNDTFPFSGGREGYGTLTAKTVDKNNNEITATVPFLFSGLPVISNVTPATFAIGNGGGQTFSFSATDQFGNPLAKGTSFTIEVGEGLDVNGDTDFILGDYLTTGTGATTFSFSVADGDVDNAVNAETTVKIKVATPTGQEASFTINGTRAKF